MDENTQSDAPMTDDTQQEPVETPSEGGESSEAEAPAMETPASEEDSSATMPEEN